MAFTRRSFLTGGSISALLSSCGQASVITTQEAAPARDLAHYRELIDGGHRVRAVRTDWLETEMLRTEVDYPTSAAAGTIVVEVNKHHLFLVLPEGRAIRYGVTLGEGAHLWRGTGTIGRIADWPKWTPTARMIRQTPSLARHSQGGMEGGPFNPLGARALYIFQNGQDTLYRVHGTHVTWRIGQYYSSGCIRMLNQDVIELASLVKLHTPILVV